MLDVEESLSLSLTGKSREVGRIKRLDEKRDAVPSVNTSVQVDQ